MAWYSGTAEHVDRRLPISIDRRFDLNCMVTTHAQLVIRSKMGLVYPDRIDIVFKAICAVRLPAYFPSLLLRHATSSELAQIREEVPNDLMRDTIVYVIEAKPRFAYVVAGSAFMCHDIEPDPNPSSLLFGDTGEGKWPEQIIRLV